MQTSRYRRLSTSEGGGDFFFFFFFYELANVELLHVKGWHVCGTFGWGKIGSGGLVTSRKEKKNTQEILLQ